MTTESQAWMIAAIMTGNLALNVIGYFVAHIPSIANGLGSQTIGWTAAETVLVGIEVAAIALLLGLTLLIQSRKTSFL